MTVVNENNISMRSAAMRYDIPYPTLRKHIIKGSSARKLGSFARVSTEEQEKPTSNCDIYAFSDTDSSVWSVTNWEDSDESLKPETSDVLPDMNTKLEQLSHTLPLDVPTSKFVFYNTENESQTIEQDLSTVEVPYTSSTSDSSTSGLDHPIASISTSKYLSPKDLRSIPGATTTKVAFRKRRC
ncbi:hypothetical protein ILUMI_13750 [Ignelater luminosus]|uniref:HTH psq-type domain-containing protein n=1 Tax=Ignelater luminosus TaxID=2038154 RepID=A0A8K0G8D3_IGNLU|nr:hypothetical protein ILUMI_13750 [Ignelater luminosus]